MVERSDRYQRATYDPVTRDWSPIEGDGRATIGECLKDTLEAPDDLPSAGILVLDTDLNDWVAHMLPSPDEPDQPMVAYNQKHVRVRRLSSAN